jgi:hypothetical protein
MSKPPIKAPDSEREIIHLRARSRKKFRKAVDWSNMDETSSHFRSGAEAAMLAA